MQPPLTVTSDRNRAEDPFIERSIMSFGSLSQKLKPLVSARRKVVVLLVIVIRAGLAVQSVTAQDSKGLGKGSFFGHWGYNRAWYTASDIHFNGPDYDFTLQHVLAQDRPDAFNAKLYLDPSTLWIPQYNYRAGWFFADRWSVSLGLDHMKYVVTQGQSVQFVGHVDATRSMDQTVIDGPQEVTLDQAFLKYEHTDGLNLLSVDLDRYDRLWQSQNGAFGVRIFEGIHAGPVIPRTDVRLFGKGLNNRWNLAGFGVGAQAGVQFEFLRHFYIRNTLRAGWIDLPRVLTTGDREDRARQHFWYVQHAIMVGVHFRIGRSKDAPELPGELRQ